MGSEGGRYHQAWFRSLAKRYSSLYDRGRDPRAAAFLHGLFRPVGGIRDVLDVACGTFSIDLGLVRRGYRVVGLDLSEDMVRVARRSLRGRRSAAEVAQGDMRRLHLGRRFDAIVCLGTAFNYLVNPLDVNRALGGFRQHLRPGGLLVLDLTNFEGWIDDPKNARADVDHTYPDGTRIAIFSFNEQRHRKTIHIARFLTVVQRGERIVLQFDEAPLQVWRKEALTRQLRRSGFRPTSWWGDLKTGARYFRSNSLRLVSVSVRL